MDGADWPAEASDFLSVWLWPNHQAVAVRRVSGIETSFTDRIDRAPRLPVQSGGPMSQLAVTLDGDRADGRVNVNFAYNQALIDMVKQIAGYWFDRDQRQWHCPREQLGHLVQLFESKGVQVNYGGVSLQQDHFGGLADEKRDMIPTLCDKDYDKKLANITADIWDKLFPYQQQGVRFGIRKTGRILLADEPGLGKTLQAVLIAAAFHEGWPLLIVCPSTLRQMWENSFREWLPALILKKLQICHVSSGKDIETKLGGPLSPKHVTIVSYEMSKKIPEGIYKKHKFVILDESHKVKGPKTQQTLHLTAVVKQAKYAVLMTGTPIQGKSTIDYFSQVDMIRPGLLGTQDDFGQRYCGGIKDTKYPNGDYIGNSNEAELNHILTETIMLRRRKQDVLKDLPDKIRVSVPCPIDGVNRKVLQGIQAQRDAILADPSLREDEKKMMADPATGEWYRKTGIAKIGGTIEHLKTLLEHDGDSKMLVFAYHREVMNPLEEFLQRTVGNNYIRIDGQTSQNVRQGRCDAFQKQPHCRVALLSIKASGVGITLTAASICVFAELSWNPSDLKQAEDRAHRVGQTKGLQIHYMVADAHESADGPMWKMLRRKEKIVGRAVDGLEEGGGSGLDFNSNLVTSTPERPESSSRRQSALPWNNETGPSGQHASPPRQLVIGQERQPPSAPQKKRSYDELQNGQHSQGTEEGQRFKRQLDFPVNGGMSGSQQGQQATAGQVLPQLMNASSSQAIGQSPNGVTPGSDVIDLTDQLGVFANEDDF